MFQLSANWKVGGTSRSAQFGNLTILSADSRLGMCSGSKLIGKLASRLYVSNTSIRITLPEPVVLKNIMPIDISIVIPVLNEEGNIVTLLGRTEAVLNELALNYEVIFVDDGSTDATFLSITAIAEKNKRIKGISLSRNFGHQIALFAGIQHTQGAVVITLDGDLQHPPEFIPKLLEKHQEGYEIVNTVRIDPQGTSRFKKNSARLFYRIINKLADIKIEASSADFRLMSRKAADAFLAIQERDRFTRGLTSWIGFKQTAIPYQAEPRASGASKYSLGNMVRFALDGITSFSSRPLQLSFYLGAIISLFGFIYGLYIVFAFFAGKTIQGWTSILLVLLIIGGVILINLGIVGEYIARIYNEVKGRPHYFIKDRTGNIT